MHVIINYGFWQFPCGITKESIQVGKLRHGFIPLVCYSQSQLSISSNNQSYKANVIFVGDKLWTLSTCILSLGITHKILKSWLRVFNNMGVCAWDTQSRPNSNQSSVFAPQTPFWSCSNSSNSRLTC